MGRTGHLFACAEDGVVPDILAIAKGLGAGYQPIGAMLASSRIFDAIVGGSGFFQHGHTYMGHATACAAALAVQQVIERDALLQNVLARGEQLRAALLSELGDHPNLGDVRGRGLFVGVEFVADKVSKQPLDPAQRTHGVLKKRAMEHGLMMYPMGGTVDGVHGDHVLLAPPFICTEADIAQIVDKFAQTVRSVLPA